ncbi:MAG: hypothetical protein H6711_25000 [Myxococcales bacterium]|nr:hypothetical protein [Myxococcales bacterium]
MSALSSTQKGAPVLLVWVKVSMILRKGSGSLAVAELRLGMLLLLFSVTLRAALDFVNSAGSSDDGSVP